METHIYTRKYPDQVYRSVLPCGAEIWTAPMKSRMVSVATTFAVGAVDDGSKKGIAHFLEHLMLKGPDRDRIHPVLRQLDNEGVRWNASTSFWRMAFDMSGLATSFDAIVDGMFDILRHPAFTPEQTESERGVILAEERERRSSERWKTWAFPRMFPSIFAPYVPIIGTPEHISAMRHDDLITHAREHLRLDRAFYGAAGGITHDAHVARILKRFPEASSPGSSRKAPSRIPYHHPDGTYVTPTKESPTALIFQFATPHDPKEQLVLALAKDGLVMRPFGLLYQELRNARRIIYDLGFSGGSFPLSGTGLDISVATEHFEETKSVVATVLRDVAIHGFPTETIAKIKRAKKIFFATRMEGIHRGECLDRLEADWYEQNVEDDDIERMTLSVTPEELQDAVATYLNPDVWSIVTCLPPNISISSPRIA